MSPYEAFLKGVEKLTSQRAEDIHEVNSSEVPQHILWDMAVCKEFEDSEAYTKTIEGKFYFTELLVNKLMYFAYLSGTKDINARSYRRGWKEAHDHILKKMR